MFANKLTISKNTFEENNLNFRQKGRLRFQKLTEAENNGLLQKASTRREVALIAGFTEEETANGKRGYSWVSNLIQKGRLKETPFDIARDGVYGNEYHIVSSPDYSNSKATKVKVRMAKKGKMSSREKGKIQYDKLCELYEQGALKRVPSRLKLGRLAGYEGPNHKCVGWVNNMLVRGYIDEKLISLPNGTITREYSITDKKPEYNLAKARIEKRRKPQPIEETVELPNAVETTGTPIKIEVSKGDMVVKMELFNDKEAVELVKQLLKGE